MTYGFAASDFASSVVDRLVARLAGQYHTKLARCSREQPEGVVCGCRASCPRTNCLMASKPPTIPAERSAKAASQTQRFISLRGVEVHNLKGFDLDIPHRQLVVICGLSGSGKTSLALDTLYAEG